MPESTVNAIISVLGTIFSALCGYAVAAQTNKKYRHQQELNMAVWREKVEMEIKELKQSEETVSSMSNKLTDIQLDLKEVKTQLKLMEQMNGKSRSL